jgi:two-component system response regulator NreC
MGETISIVLADDHAVVRSALSLLLEAEQDFEVVAEVGDIESTLQLVAEHRPDVLILDLNMPGGRTLGAVPQLLASSPGTGVVVLTMETDPTYARRAMQAGVLGYLLKQAVDEELVSAVRLAADGRTYLQPELGARLAADDGPDNDGLSSREHEILRLIAFGHTNTEIAEQLFLSVRTVESHRAQVQRKLGLGKRSELVRYALQRGLLDSES